MVARVGCNSEMLPREPPLSQPTLATNRRSRAMRAGRDAMAFNNWASGAMVTTFPTRQVNGSLPFVLENIGSKCPPTGSVSESSSLFSFLSFALNPLEHEGENQSVSTNRHHGSGRLSVPSPARSTYMSFLFLFMYEDDLFIGPRFGQICEGWRGRRGELFRFVGGMLISIYFFTK
jgi:hypothetical protein